MDIVPLTPALTATYRLQVPRLHGRYYTRAWGFGQFFEDKVSSELTAFAARRDPATDGVWCVLLDDAIAASITIDGAHLGGNRAHLRWFIVDDGLRGTGAGNGLMQCAMAFVHEKRFDAVELWTFAGLDAARHLYEKYGFELVESRHATTWGRELLEQRFEKRLTPA